MLLPIPALLLLLLLLPHLLHLLHLLLHLLLRHLLGAITRLLSKLLGAIRILHLIRAVLLWVPVVLRFHLLLLLHLPPLPLELLKSRAPL